MIRAGSPSGCKSLTKRNSFYAWLFSPQDLGSKAKHKRVRLFITQRGRTFLTILAYQLSMGACQWKENHTGKK